MSSQYRNWCFTINNYDDISMFEVYELQFIAKYVVAGIETGDSGTPHIQGFVCFESAKTMSAVSKLLHRAHLEPKSKFSTFKQAADYCKKDGEFFEHGNLPLDQEEKGERGKLAIKERWELAEAGKFKDLPPEHHRTYKQIFNEARDPQSRKALDNIWLQGDAGVGKSKLTKQFGKKHIFIKNSTKWWDNYKDQPVVIFEDVDPGWFKEPTFIGLFKLWNDHYPFPAETKGSSMVIRPLKMIVTSQYSIGQCITSFEDKQALYRRFKQYNMTEGWIEPEGFFRVDKAVLPDVEKIEFFDSTLDASTLDVNTTLGEEGNNDASSPVSNTHTD